MAKSKKTAKKSASKSTKKTKNTAKKTTASAAFDREKALQALEPGYEEQAPNQPVANALQDARLVLKAAKNESEELTKLSDVGFWIAGLPTLISTLETSQDTWNALRSKQRSKEFKALVREGEQLKRDLLAAGRYLLRKNEEAQNLLDIIAEGDGIPDQISDLNALASFASTYKAALATATFPDGLEQAINRAREIAELLAEQLANEGADTTAGKALRVRNTEFALLDHAMSEIREAARYAFRAEPERIKPFRVPERRTGRKKKEAPAPAPK